jgi:hypothetical protein
MFKVKAKTLFDILYFSGTWNIFWSPERTLNANKCQHPTGLHHPLDGVTNPNYKLLRFIQLTIFLKKEEGTSF